MSYPRTRRGLLDEDNQGVVNILNAMVTASTVMMAELRRLEVLLRVFAVRIDARWIQFAVNRFVDSPSRTWDACDARAPDVFLQSI